MFRLATSRATYRRTVNHRTPFSKTNITGTSDVFLASVRATRNIRRGKRLILTRGLRAGYKVQRRNMLRAAFGKTGTGATSDAFASPAQRRFKTTWRYWRQR